MFSALGDDTRWEILSRLGEGPASASALARELPVTRQAIVKHLEVLRSVGLVEAEQQGRELVHRALGGRLNEVARGLEQIADAWDTQLVLVKRLAEQQDRGSPVAIVGGCLRDASS
ncbi:MAG: ArsR/SmtB family transcription factor [Nocardioides sp.]